MTYKATTWEAECDTFDPKRPYHVAKGFGFSNSPKEAIRKAEEMLSNNSKGWTPTCGELKLYKNHELILKEI